jgi:hypothetical protein
VIFDLQITRKPLILQGTQDGPLHMMQVRGGQKSAFPEAQRIMKTKGLVGAGGFEPPTPCAQGGFRLSRKCSIFKVLGFNEMRATCKIY